MGNQGFNSADEFLSIREEEGKLKFKKRKLRARCPHVNRKGHQRLNPTNSEFVFECKDCKTVMDLRPYSNGNNDAAMEHLENSVNDVINALQIVKFRASLTKDKDSNRISEQCANLILEIGSVSSLLDAVIQNSDKRKDKKKKRGMLVAMGGNSLRFGGKKEKSGW